MLVNITLEEGESIETSQNAVADCPHCLWDSLGSLEEINRHLKLTQQLLWLL